MAANSFRWKILQFNSFRIKILRSSIVVKVLKKKNILEKRGEGVPLGVRTGNMADRLNRGISDTAARIGDVRTAFMPLEDERGDGGEVVVCLCL
jgi:hypothetical protein